MRNPVRRIFSYGVVMTVLILGAVVLLFRHGINSYNEAEAAVEEVVGMHVVLEGDTLLIIDYLWHNNNFMLNNGAQISADLLDDLKVLP